MKNIVIKLTTNVLSSAMLFSNSVFPNATSINLNQLVSAPDNIVTAVEDDTGPEFQFNTPLIIKAINPGYTENKVRDVGELVELQLIADATPFSLAGYTLRYINSSGKSTTLIEFSEGSSIVGEFLLLRLARTADSESADATYSTTIAMGEGTLQLWHNNQITDQVCWAKSETCYAPFDSNAPTTLVRDFTDGTFKHLPSYDTHYDSDNPSLVLPPSESDLSENNENPASALTSCKGVEFTEILSYYVTDKSEQFIELYNATDEMIELTGCSLRYKNKVYPLAGEIIAEGYVTFYPYLANPSFTLTKDPSTSNNVELLDTDGEVIDILTYSHGQKKSTSYAKFIDETSTETWERTYAPTPGSSNIYQEFRTCPEGKVINEATGNCIKITSAQKSTEIAACPEGKYRNPLTGRCKKIESAASSEPKPCAEGYERNPETNRCRKIKSTNDGENYALVPTTYADNKTFVALGIVLLLTSAGTIYIVLQFRHEIARSARKARQRLHHIRKDLIARYISFHRHK